MVCISTFGHPLDRPIIEEEFTPLGPEKYDELVTKYACESATEQLLQASSSFQVWTKQMSSRHAEIENAWGRSMSGNWAHQMLQGGINS